jgi:hypothetical protein
MANTTKKKIPTDVKTDKPVVSEGSGDMQEVVQEELAAEVTKPKRATAQKTKPKKAVTTRLISATSKVSTELDGNWYSFSFSESREVHDDEDIDAARLDLWNTVHTEVDTQVSYTIESIRGTAEPQQNAAGVPQNYGIPPQYDY